MLIHQVLQFCYLRFQLCNALITTDDHVELIMQSGLATTRQADTILIEILITLTAVPRDIPES